jgi:hypothetical protein
MQLACHGNGSSRIKGGSPDLIHRNPGILKHQVRRILLWVAPFYLQALDTRGRYKPSHHENVQVQP